MELTPNLFPKCTMIELAAMKQSENVASNLLRRMYFHEEQPRDVKLAKALMKCFIENAQVYALTTLLTNAPFLAINNVEGRYLSIAYAWAPRDTLKRLFDVLRREEDREVFIERLDLPNHIACKLRDETQTIDNNEYDQNNNNFPPFN